jgi:hypothetical protein
LKTIMHMSPLPIGCWCFDLPDVDDGKCQRNIRLGLMTSEMYVGEIPEVRAPCSIFRRHFDLSSMKTIYSPEICLSIASKPFPMLSGELSHCVTLFIIVDFTLNHKTTFSSLRVVGFCGQIFSAVDSERTWHFRCKGRPCSFTLSRHHMGIIET